MSGLKLNKYEIIDVYRPDGSFLFSTDSQEILDKYIVALNLLESVKEVTNAHFITKFKYKIHYCFTLNF